MKIRLMAKKKAKKKTGAARKKTAAKKAPAAGKKTARKKAPAARKKTTKKPVKKTVAPIPAGYHTLTPYLTVRGCAEAIEFYKKAFGAKEKGRITMADGKIGHAEIQIGDSRIMLADEMPEWGNKGPQLLGGTPIGLALYVKDADAAFARALAAGGTVQKKMENQFYGDRSGTIIDPYGHIWTLGTRKENLSFKKMQERMEAMMAHQ